MKFRKKLRSCPALIAFTLGLFSSGSLYAFTEVYNTEGTFEWVCPADVTSITVECWGGGGAGGSAYRFAGATNTNHAGGGGGGGGAYAKTAAIAVTPGTTYTVLIPGRATNPYISGSPIIVDGGNVSFTGDSATVTAAGGKGGESIEQTENVPKAGAGGFGGDSDSTDFPGPAVSIGETTFSGGDGSARTPSQGGPGGGGAGDASPGGDAAPTVAGAGGLQGGGNGGNGVGGQRNGFPGADLGGGGGGGRSQTPSVGYDGGTGGIGQIRLSDGVALASVKADNADDLNLESSWTGVVPGTADVAVWDSTVTTANTTFLGANIAWAGIKIENPAGLVTIEAGNVLTLGLADTDLDLTAATVDLTLNCALAMSAPNIWNIPVDRTLTLAGNISGNVPVSKLGDGTLILSGANNFNPGNGGITIAAGTLKLGASNVIPEGFGQGNLNLNGTFDLNGFSEAITGLTGMGIVDTTAVDGISTLTVGRGLSSSNFNGTIQNTVGTLNLVKIESGTTQLSNANTFSGTVQVDAGALQLNDPLALQNVASITMVGGSLAITSDGTTLTAPITLNGNARFVSPADLAIATFSGAISGTGVLTKDGAGTLVLSGALSYTGDTVISAGTLSVGSSNAESDTSTVTVGATGALLQLNYTGTDNIGRFVTGATEQPGGVYGHTDSGADNGGQGIGALDAFFAPGSGTLSIPVVASGYQNWASGFPGLTNTDPSVDFDLGSLETGIEFVVGGDPTLASDDVSLAPTSKLVGTDLVFEYRRTPLANADPNTTIEVQYGSDLVGWTPATADVPGVTIAVNTGFYGNDDQVVVTLSEALTSGGKIFARLKANIVTP